MTSLSLIVAMDENRLIGSNNELPWNLPADLAYFKRTTMGKPIVMGRKTFESIGKPLRGRRNIVLTRDVNFSAAGCEVTHGIEEAQRLCEGAAEIMLIGGASLYEQAMGLATRLYITRIHHGFNGDTWFPEFDPAEWRLEHREDFDADHNNPYSYSFIKFIREN
ncbi:MAG: type 3 dihydrofolate reductase [Gammaproteobacteria bacterium]|nr:type 3 dihydrofolate reductase [Gammaproteobacteria bacterium]MDH3537677.1 type 3 dihydrofolate reductase [Gammaproteobacteria bacterium]